MNATSRYYTAESSEYKKGHKVGEHQILKYPYVQAQVRTKHQDSDATAMRSAEQCRALKWSGVGGGVGGAPVGSEHQIGRPVYLTYAGMTQTRTPSTPLYQSTKA